MPAVDPVSEALVSERQQLALGSTLHWSHWFILVLSALLTMLAWNALSNQTDDRIRAQFDREVERITPLIEERLRKYEDVLWSGVAALSAARGQVSRAQWRAYATNLRLPEKYPGIMGIGIIQAVPKEDLASHEATQQRSFPGYKVYPDHAGDEHLPIVFIEPQALNRKAVGLDMVHETNRYAAARKARQTGLAQITAPIVLVQDEGHEPGFLFYAPYFDRVAEGTAGEFLGLVYAPFVVAELMQGTLDRTQRQVNFRLTDSAEVIYDEGLQAATVQQAPAHMQRIALGLYGREWVFELWSTPEFEALTASNQPLYVLIGGLTIDALLLALFLFMSRGNRRALRFADRMTEALRAKAADLEVSNADLESFAYVASHDLKTPLRGIATLGTFLKDDLQSYVDSPQADPAVRKNLRRLTAQTERMGNLINGILAYSRVGRNEAVETVDVRTVVRLVAEDLSVDPSQIDVADACPVFETYSVRFSQVLHNIVGNAFKYHEDPALVRVQIGCDVQGDFYVFSIADNGSGVESQYLERMFGAFQTLQSKDVIESTGIGLAIVKRTVNGLGGWVRAESEVGEGLTVVFSWPKEVASAADGA